MKTDLKTGALAIVLIAATFSQASAWERNTTFSGPRGSGSISGSGSCTSGSCTSSRTRTGVYGNTITRQGSRDCANGACSRTSTVTGPRGQNRTRQTTTSR